MHTAPYFTALGLLAFYFAVRVIRLRWRHKVSLGDGGVPELHHAIRAFGNFSEYAGLGLVLLMALEYVQAPPWYMHMCGLTLLAGRISHGIAFSKQEIDFRFRAPGMVMTFFSLVMSSIGVTLFSLVDLHS